MTSLDFVLLSGTLTFGVPLAVAIWELTHLPTFPKGGDEPPPPRLPRAPAPLPDCLLPPPVPVRAPAPPVIRMLEDA